MKTVSPGGAARERTRHRDSAIESRMVTIRDVAEHAHVSRSTVSRVLNSTVPVAPAKRAAVLNAVEALSYRPSVVAQELARGSSNAIGVLPQGLSNPFFGRLLKGVEQGLRGSGYYPLFASGEQPSDEARALDLLLSHRVDALILIGGHLPDADLVRLAERVPLIAIARTVVGLEHRCLRVGHVEGAYKATRHLLNLGHKRIAHIGGLPWHTDAISRREGYERALAEAGIALDPALLFEGDFEEQSGLTVTEKLLASGTPFSAIFASNDLMAYGAGLALYRHGRRVPHDVSLVGFDDQPSAAYTCPPLTTVRQPTIEMGMAAARALLDQLRGRGFALPAFNTDLVLRDSTGPALNR
jgi:LacI family transcriptional regulator